LKFCRIDVNTNSKVQPSFFTGSALRGTFGHLLKENVCVTPSYDCNHCLYKEACLYYDYYESSNGYRPFRFNIRLNAKNYNFGLYIFGDNASKVRIIIKTLHDMLLSKRLTDKKLSFPKSKIFLNEKQVTFDKNGTLLPFETIPHTLTIEKYHRDISIQLLTPAIIKDANSKYKKEITLEDLLTSIYKRKCYFENGKVVHRLDHTPSYSLASNALMDVKTTRRSDRQDKTIVLEGMVGKLVVMNLDPESYALLKWGEILAVGNKTVFGHGAINIEV